MSLCCCAGVQSRAAAPTDCDCQGERPNRHGKRRQDKQEDRNMGASTLQAHLHSAGIAALTYVLQ